MRTVALSILAILLVSCSNTTPSASLEPIADTYFSGCAYIDQNDNGTLDSGESLLGGFTFTITLAGGAGFGAETAEGQCATVIVPSALPEDSWPVTARISIPEGSGYEAVGSTEVALEYPQTKAEFPFITK
jgi:hypothetical protein